MGGGDLRPRYQHLTELWQKDDLSLNSDPIRDQLDEILKDHVGPASSREEIAALQLEIQASDPPGYADAENGSVQGDATCSMGFHMRRLRQLDCMEVGG